ncbi:tRNA1(Val) (adenine(37)-N6)-methyltransferase [Pasteurella canis]|uniref:tRNA1(Val) (adenine(37)-N6)-methyltransferase n=1 Tax=Pasteurella canis TaxID=753 RepID=UPI001D124A50|nr:tRNA1(Val) (adenine(37)-N6)-methyltransferase [Pasteurella canis]UDW83218.1 tRNA1(Val) (adenine(37)-N6)-methyltransferase [Pasteurella canis]
MSAKNNGFTFKQFHIHHDRCAMKVGTDGILLGAWAEVKEAKRILDLGTGTGLIALMLAQRSNVESHIWAIELDHDAFLQAKTNIEQSKWAAKVSLLEQDVANFCLNTQEKFDLIVANPPYFPQGVACRTEQRQLARYAQQQTHADWLHFATHCLTEQGKISLVLPYEAGKTLLKQTALYCTQYCEVITKQGKSPQRLLLTFSTQSHVTQKSQIMIYDKNNQYHPDFMTLTREFYLKF